MAAAESGIHLEVALARPGGRLADRLLSDELGAVFAWAWTYGHRQHGRLRLLGRTGRTVT